MAVPSETSVIEYTGNNSTVTPYVIPFPFLETDDIRVAVAPDVDEDFVELSSSGFTVTRNEDGGGGSLVTTAAHASPAIVKIWRWVEFTQPTVFQPQGPFPAKTAETAFDRTEMQIQQLAALIDGAIPGVGSGGDGVASWLDAAARALVTPSKKNQLGIEEETQTLWISQSTDIGDWEEYRPIRVNKVVLGFTADAGEPGDSQDAVAQIFADWNVDAALFGGDNNYNGDAGYDDDWEAFEDFIADGNAYPALGNHDMDSGNFQSLLDAKFPYLPGNRRYYKVSFGDGLVDLFVLNSGRDSTWDLVEEHDVGSDQHAWFVEQLNLSRARWKIAMFHHPPITASMGENRNEPEMQWPELLRVDLVLTGHNHLLEVLKWQNVQIIGGGGSVRTDGGLQALPQGAFPGDAVLWADDESSAAIRIMATHQKLITEVWQIGLPYGANRLMHCRECRDFTKPNLQAETFRIVPAGTALGSTSVAYVCILPMSMILREAEVINDLDGSLEMQWTIKGGSVELIHGTIAAGQTRGTAISEIPDDLIPRGSIISIEIADADDREGLTVSLIFERYK